MALVKEPTTVLSLRVPLEVWELWKTLPDEKKEMAKRLFLVLLVGVTRADELDLGTTKEIVLKADESLLNVIKRAFGAEEDKCKKVVEEYLKKVEEVKGAGHYPDCAFVLRKILERC
jgi:hypothetical protein